MRSSIGLAHTGHWGSVPVVAAGRRGLLALGTRAGVGRGGGGGCVVGRGVGRGGSGAAAAAARAAAPTLARGGALLFGGVLAIAVGTVLVSRLALRLA